MKKIFLTVTILALLCACATPYKKASSPKKKGYFTTKLQDKVYDVTFNASDETDLKKAKDYALLRAAEVCLENNYQTFNIIDKEDNTITKEPQISIMVLCSPQDDLFFKAKDIKDNLRKKYRIK